jgi:hypothetical protein
MMAHTTSIIGAAASSARPATNGSIRYTALSKCTCGFAARFSAKTCSAAGVTFEVLDRLQAWAGTAAAALFQAKLKTV